MLRNSRVILTSALVTSHGAAQLAAKIIRRLNALVMADTVHQAMIKMHTTISMV